MASSWPDGDLAALIEEVTVDAYGDEGFSAFVCAFDELEGLPDATVIGEAVSVRDVVEGDDGTSLRARCQRGGREYEVSLLDLTFPSHTEAARLLAAYRRWLGLDG